MLSVIVPTLNEPHNVEELSRRIASALTQIVPFEIIFVDDSADETPQVLKKLSDTYAFVRYVHRQKNTGLAMAAVEGFGLAYGETLAVIDADLQHPPQLLAIMYREIEKGADIVLPSRYVESEQSEGLNFVRQIISSGAKRIGMIFVPALRQISDPTGGYFMFRSSVIAGKKLRPIGWKILVEVMALGNYSSVVEVPYEFQERYTGYSKMSFKVSMQYLFHIASLFFRKEKGQHGETEPEAKTSE